jgi:hypothetical protein
MSRSEVNARRLSGGAASSTRPVVPLKTVPARAALETDAVEQISGRGNVESA